MKKQQVCCMTRKSLKPPNCRCMKDKWVFKIKCNSVYQVHLITCGYSKVPSIDVLENYSPVVNSVTFLVPLLKVIHFGYLAKLVK